MLRWGSNPEKGHHYPLLIVKGDNMGHPALTKLCYGFDSRLVLGPLRVGEWQQ